MHGVEPLHVKGVAVTIPLVHQFGVEPSLGRWFDDDSGAVISSALWRRLGANPGIIGQGLTLDGRAYTVTGVMPASFHLPVTGQTVAADRVDVWTPLDVAERDGCCYQVYARRKPGVSAAAVTADVTRVAAALVAENPQRRPTSTARVRDLHETVIERVRPTLLLLFAAAALLFLIACASAAGLLLSRSVARARETAMRVALGASRGQLAMQYVAEGLLIALPAAAIGIGLSVVVTPAVVSLAADYLPRADDIHVDWRVLGFALGAAAVAGILSSLAPLRQAARTTPAAALGDGVRVSAGLQTRRASRALVVAEVALAFGLLTVSAALIVHVRHLAHASPGFDADNLLTFVLSVPGTIAFDPDQRIPNQKRLVAAIGAIPGVDAVAFANQMPLTGWGRVTSIHPEGAPDAFAYAVRQRSMEIGMRMILGASGQDVLTLVLGDGLRLAAYGMVAGGVVAIGGVYMLGRVFDAVATGAAPYIYSTAIVAVLAVVASLVPALRAAVKSPVVVLREGS